MGISEFALHNVLRTYSRQDRLGKVHKAKAANTQATKPADQVTLSNTGRKAQWVGQLAAEIVDQRHPGLDTNERSAKVRNTKAELLERHQDELGDETVAPEALQQRLRPLYLG